MFTGESGLTNTIHSSTPGDYDPVTGLSTDPVDNVNGGFTDEGYKLWDFLAPEDPTVNPIDEIPTTARIEAGKNGLRELSYKYVGLLGMLAESSELNDMNDPWGFAAACEEQLAVIKAEQRAILEAIHQ